MSTPVIALPLSSAGSASAKRKRVLLLDASQTKRDLRADVMRKLGIEVDCAADVLEARCWWRADLYNLVLINGNGEPEECDRFCADIRDADPPRESPSSSAARNIFLSRPILTPRLQRLKATLRKERWSLRSRSRRRSVPRSAGEYLRPAAGFPRCAPSARLGHGPFGRRRSPRVGQKLLSNTPQSLILKPHLRLRSQQKEKAYEESVCWQFAAQHDRSGASRRF